MQITYLTVSVATTAKVKGMSCFRKPQQKSQVLWVTIGGEIDQDLQESLQI